MGIVVYGNGCPKCNILIKKLDEKGIEYEKSENMQELIDLGFKTVPVIVLNGEYMDFGKAVQYINNLK